MYSIKYNFSKINNEIEAYILGFLFSDGYILASPYYRTGIQIAQRDESLLRQIVSYISDDSPIKYEVKKHGSHMCKFEIYRKDVFYNLMNMGMSPNKTGKELHIPAISKELIRHFFRGYFDGDGSLIEDRRYLYLYICSPTNEILGEFKDILARENITSSIMKDNRKGKLVHIHGKDTILNFDQYRLYIRTRNNMEKIYNYMYRDCSIKMERKFLKFSKWLQEKKIIKRNSK